jgi:hypothetical protein
MSLFKKLLGKATNRNRPFDQALLKFLQDLWVGLGGINLARTAEATGDVQGPIDQDRMRQLVGSMMQLPLHSLSLAMFATEMATALADELRLPERGRRDLCRTILSKGFGSETPVDGELLGAHADTIAQMFAEGGAAAMTLNVPQVDFILGVLAGNRVALDFLRCWRADGEQPKPNQAFVDETALALMPASASLPRALPTGKQVFYLRRAYRPEPTADGSAAWNLFDASRRRLTDLTIEQGYVPNIEGRAPLGLAVAVFSHALLRGPSAGVDLETSFNTGIGLLRECLNLTAEIDKTALSSFSNTALDACNLVVGKAKDTEATETLVADDRSETAGALLGQLLTWDRPDNVEGAPLRASLWDRARKSPAFPA